jgi:hypothetical protein
MRHFGVHHPVLRRNSFFPELVRYAIPEGTLSSKAVAAAYAASERRAEPFESSCGNKNGFPDGKPHFLGSGGFEPSKAEPTDLQRPRIAPYKSIQRYLV